MSAPEFVAWPKTPRLFRDVIITEKIDGTNGAVIVTDDGRVFAQSRKRLLVDGADNFGFRAWVDEHAEGLADYLGPGRHFGEWYGRGIQRSYGMPVRRFALFNIAKHDRATVRALGIGLDVVPVLFEGEFDTHLVRYLVDELADYGSQAVPGFDRPEGVVVFHPQAGHGFKVLCENDELPKSQTVHPLHGYGVSGAESLRGVAALPAVVNIGQSLPAVARKAA